MIHLELLMLCVAGFLLLILAMARHQPDWLKRRPGHARNVIIRLMGLILLSLALVVAVISLGWAYGTIIWFGWLSMGAATVVAANASRQQRLQHNGRNCR